MIDEKKLAEAQAILNDPETLEITLGCAQMILANFPKLIAESRDLMRRNKKLEAVARAAEKDLQAGSGFARTDLLEAIAALKETP